MPTLTAERRESAKAFIEQAAKDRLKIGISPVSLAEIVYLIKKSRIPISAFDDLRQALENENHVFHEAPFTGEVTSAMREISREAVPDMPDRVVAATGLYLGVPVLSRDAKIRAANINTVW